MKDRKENSQSIKKSTSTYKVLLIGDSLRLNSNNKNSCIQYIKKLETGDDFIFIVPSEHSEILDLGIIAENLSTWLNCKPDVVVIYVGFVESLTGKLNSIEQKQFDQIKDILLNSLENPAILVLPPPLKEPVIPDINVDSNVNQNIANFNNWITSTSKYHRNFRIINCYEKFEKWGTKESLMDDGFSPTIKATKRIAKLVLKLLKSLKSESLSVVQPVLNTPIIAKQYLQLTAEDAIKRSALAPDAENLARQTSNGYGVSRCVKTANILNEFFTVNNFQKNKILEFGPGQYAFALLARSLGAEVICVDKDPKIVQLGRKLDFKVIEASMYTLKPAILPEQFDGIWLKGAFNPMKLDFAEIASFIGKIVKWLKPDGWALIAPNGRLDAINKVDYYQDLIDFQSEYFWRKGFDFWHLNENERENFALKLAYYGSISGIYTLNLKPKKLRQNCSSKSLGYGENYQQKPTINSVHGKEKKIDNRIIIKQNENIFIDPTLFINKRILLNLQSFKQRKVQEWAWSCGFCVESAILLYSLQRNPINLEVPLKYLELIINSRDSDYGIVDTVRGRTMKSWGWHTFLNNGKYTCMPVTAARLALPFALVAECLEKYPAKQYSNLPIQEWLDRVVEALAEFDSDFRCDKSEGWGYYYRPALDDIDPLNHLACIGRAYLHLGKVLSSQELLEKAQLLAGFIRRSFKQENNGSYSWGYASKPERWHNRYPSKSWKEGLTVTFVLEAYEQGIAFSYEDIQAIVKTGLLNVFSGVQGDVNSLISSEITEKLSDRLINWQNEGKISHRTQLTGILEWIILWKYEESIIEAVDNFFNDYCDLFWGSWLCSPRSILAYIHRLYAEVQQL